MLKAIVFGVLIALVGCYKGYMADGGARGVGWQQPKLSSSARSPFSHRLFSHFDAPPLRANMSC